MIARIPKRKLTGLCVVMELSDHSPQLFTILDIEINNFNNETLTNKKKVYLRK